MVNNKRIAKNTILLYIRMLLIMAVTFYTARVILQTLGIEDYGIYNLIGGFVTLLSFISNALVASIQRYMNIALGEEDKELFKKVYSVSFNIIAIFSLIFLLLAESVGLWFVVTKLNIPYGRESAAFWVYQISIFTTVVSLLRAPDNACIIAHEKMSFYAYISIFETIIKLLIVYTLLLFDSDKLILYVLLYFFSTIVINIFYKIYVNHFEKSCRFVIIWDKSLTKNMLSFTGWNMVSNAAHVATSQGENLMLNNYFSVAVNAARGVSAQVYNAVNIFLTNFQTAFRPQLIQTYAAGQHIEHFRLVFRSARFSWYLMLILVVPIITNLKIFLGIWLAEVPEYTYDFCFFILIAYLLDSMGMPLATSIYANGNIRNMQIVSALLYLIELLSCFILLSIGFPAYSVAILTMVTHLSLLVVDIFYCKRYCLLQIKEFIKEVVVPCFICSVFSCILPLLVNSCVTTFVSAIMMSTLYIIWELIVISVLGLSKSERLVIVNLIKNKIKK